MTLVISRSLSLRRVFYCEMATLRDPQYAVLFTLSETGGGVLLEEVKGVAEVPEWRDV